MSVAAETASARPPLVTQKSDAEKRKNSIKRKIVVGPAITPRYEYTMNKQRSKSFAESKSHNGVGMTQDIKPKGFLSAF
ncbi:hypothetical protein TELCIR_11019 [Teladorsagia circumcincta]|uniref:Uncharacterized protein n=1 Tax=Teladorsagia circumcincta TaxID=45464 RepID=A0A2G9UAH5_TELCI|nr:hypothetical protein TELCIR_11019 [Teladorsagia circumcincta]